MRSGTLDALLAELVRGMQLLPARLPRKSVTIRVPLGPAGSCGWWPFGAGFLLVAMLDHNIDREPGDGHNDLWLH